MLEPVVTPVESFVRLILERALMENAADVHLEPWEKEFQIRLRTPQGMVTLPAPQADLFPALVRHFKLLAKLDIATEALPQDGKFVLEVGGGLVEFRLSSLPTVWGPSLVLRVLDKYRTPLQLDALGFDAKSLQQLKDALGLPFGLVAIVGPTGSGKTTTLYACLRHLAADGTRKILSVEDPVEYALPGVQQVAVGDNLDFSTALRAFLRHDPDVIMVGEIRDGATARLAVQAALTGHLVLSSLHTGSYQQVVPRLEDLGVEQYLIDSALKCVLVQEMRVEQGVRRPVATVFAHQAGHPARREAYA